MANTSAASMINLSSAKSDGFVSLPNPGTSHAEKLEPGAYTQFMFKMSDVSDVALRPDGTLEMKLTNGSTIVIENFQDLANSAQSCGRDTVFQFLNDQASVDGQQVTKIMNISPDALLRTLDPSLANDKTITINEPAAGATREVVMEPGQEYKFNFDWNAAAKTVDGTNLMLSFKDGGLIVLRDFVPVTEGDLPPAMTLADGTVVDAHQLIVAACAPAETKVAAIVHHEPAVQVAHVEPKKAPIPVQDIEPAAGGEGAPAIGGRGGAGFSSGIDPANLNGLSPLGPLGPTELNYNIPRIPDSPSDGTPGTELPPEPVDGQPVVGDAVATIDETNLGPISIDGTYDYDFGSDEAGSLGATGENSFSAGGSLEGGALTSDGYPVAVTLSGNVYTGTANGQTIFTMTINPDGTYNFVQFGNLDHADGTDPNDSIALNFGVTISDRDGDTDTGVITINVLDDAPTANDDTLTNVNGVATGNVTTNDRAGVDGATVTGVLYNGTTYPVPATGTTTVVGAFGTLVISASGEYTYTATNGENGTDVFTYTLTDGDGDQDTANLSITCADGVPIVGDALGSVDESGLGTSVGVNGTYTFDYGSDGAGTLGASGASSFSSGGSKEGGQLTSDGAPVTVTLSGNTYTGTANGVTIFTMVINPDGTYAYQQFGNLDHADGSNPNDVISLNFGVTITDADGDTDTGTITINVLDDAPVANDDTVTAVTNVATGNVSTNDDPGSDGGTVTSVLFNGTAYTVPATGTTSIVGVFGTLVISATGEYTYTAKNGVSGTDTFTYTLTDGDGDQDTANLTLTCADGIPFIGDSTTTVDETGLNITQTGTYSFGYGSDGAGSIKMTGFASGGSKEGGALTSDGVPVTVSLSGSTYTGTANGVTIFTMTLNADGTYTYQQFGNLDHADGNNPDDVITLTFNTTITDKDGDTDTGNIVINVKDDAPTANDDLLTNVNGVATGNVTTNDRAGNDGATVTSVLFNGTTYPVAATGNTTIVGAFGTLVISATGAYTYTAKQGATGNDSFTYTLTDGDGDKDTAVLSIGTKDSIPVVNDAVGTVDETNLGPITLNGTYTYNYGTDGAGSLGATGASSFSSGGSKDNGALTSDGYPVTVTLSGNTYTGTANGQTIFTMTINPDGTYRFVQTGNLDHADPANPNDSISLNFGVTIKDKDGDTDTGVITINVLDDAPVANDDTATIVNNVATGNVTGNDTAGADGATVTSVLFNGTTYPVAATGNTTIVGAYGTLVISATGAYTYTAKQAVTGTDTFTYTLTDGDGDKDTANLVVNANDGCPIIYDTTATVDESGLNLTLVGSYQYGYGTDGAGSIKMTSFSSSGSKENGALTSDGAPVVVTLSGSTYTGTANGQTIFTMTLNADGTYTYKQFGNLDHADTNNPDDVITLSFATQITDKDGDTDEGIINIRVQDDAPVANDDVIAAGNGAKTGNVMTNDDAGNDGGTVTSVLYNGTNYTVPATGNATIVGVYGTLVISATGAYTYTPKNGATGTDAFTYTLTDGDGDKDTAVLSVGSADGVPVVGDATNTVDETNLGPITVNGTYTYNYGSDGAGSIKATGTSSFSSGGSKEGGTLTSDGYPVTVTLSGNTYTGTANGQTVFTMTVNTNGTYTFVQTGNLDHANTTNPDDVITLNFGVTITDKDGDIDTGNIAINVKDDGPIANDDAVTTVNNVAGGNVTSNDDAGSDGGTITSVVFNGTTYPVAASGNTSIVGAFGTLVISATGAYTYTARNGVTGTDKFTYTLTDGDGDKDTAVLTVGSNDGLPVIGDAINSVDETGLGPLTVNGTYTYNYGTDGAGAIKMTGFSSGGSKDNGALTSDGSPIVVTLSGSTYTGVAHGETIFTMTLNADGTYTFKQYGNLDHADPANPNDVISLNFTTTITDKDGDTDTGVITINVLDDAPVAVDDRATTTGNPVSGNVLSNDSSVENPAVTAVTINGVAHAVNASGNTTIEGQYGTLVISASGAYTYTPHTGTGETIKTVLYPEESDVAGMQTSITFTGITISSTNGSDLTWNQGFFFGDYGVGVAGNGDNHVNGNESIKVSVDNPSDLLTVYVGDWDLIDNSSGTLYARVYLEGSTTPTIVPMDDGVQTSILGVVGFEFASEDFGGKEITSVEIYSTDPAKDFTIYGVESCVYPDDNGTDNFTYTVTDSDGDQDTGILAITNNTPAAQSANEDLSVMGAETDMHTMSVVDFGDDVSTAVHDFVVSTSVPDNVTSTDAPADRVAANDLVITTPIEDDQHHAAAA